MEFQSIKASDIFRFDILSFDRVAENSLRLLGASSGSPDLGRLIDGSGALTLQTVAGSRSPSVNPPKLLVSGAGKLNRHLKLIKKAIANLRDPPAFAEFIERTPNAAIFRTITPVYRLTKFIYNVSANKVIQSLCKFTLPPLRHISRRQFEWAI